jgi:hypothetical protein
MSELLAELSEAQIDELREANERISEAMLSNYYTVEEPVFGGFMSSTTMVRVTYNDLRIVLAVIDKLRPVHAVSEQEKGR